MIACQETREAIIVDPNADIGLYTRAAGADRMRITHVTETHIHADFVSGALALAESAGAALHLSGEGDPKWSYIPSVLDASEALKDGDEIRFGRVRLRALHTPGHTPEHLTFLVFDLARGDDPVGALTGDFVFVGDVGRPDLLEKAVGATNTMVDSARQLYRSLRKFAGLPDYLQLWPGHGAGSACGKSLGSMPQSTLGYEKMFNWAFAPMTEDQFVEKVLEGQPVPPKYFAAMKAINRSGERQPKTSSPKFLGADDLESAVRKGATIVDTRTVQKYAAGHLPGTLNIPLGKSFLGWSGALVPTRGEFSIVTDRAGDEAVKEILAELCKIGLTAVRGIFHSDLLDDWKSRHGELERVAQVDADQLKAMTAQGNVQVIDVRNPDEWAGGHLPGAMHIPLAALPDKLDELDRSTPVVLQCQGGERSAIATSLLQSRGMSNVANLAGGYEEWVRKGFPVTAEMSATK